ncbi:MAG: hypothetical protein QG653_33 [Patescibacteria group bacterium]|nr:hypothetical protein [Patescibacteria group bacterium]
MAGLTIRESASVPFVLGTTTPDTLEKPSSIHGVRALRRVFFLYKNGAKIFPKRIVLAPKGLVPIFVTLPIFVRGVLEFFAEIERPLIGFGWRYEP